VDARKADLNLHNHGVAFEEAEAVFDDPLDRIFEDTNHSNDEQRGLIVGYPARGRLLSVSFAERDDVIRIVSARKAEPWERRDYEQGTRR
jgi:uncharacterized DUF497 family protein